MHLNICTLHFRIDSLIFHIVLTFLRFSRVSSPLQKHCVEGMIIEHIVPSTSNKFPNCDLPLALPEPVALWLTGALWNSAGKTHSLYFMRQGKCVSVITFDSRADYLLEFCHVFIVLF